MVKSKANKQKSLKKVSREKIELPTKELISKNNGSKKDNVENVITKCKIIRKRRVRERKYTEDVLKQALDELGAKEGTIRQISEKFGISKSTLHNKMTLKSPLVCKKGPPPVLGLETEDRIVEWIIYCQKRGFPVVKERLIVNVQTYLKDNKIPNKFKNNRPSNKWYNSFLRRHKSRLSKRIAQKLTVTRALVTEEDLASWLDLVKSNLDNKDLANIHSRRIFNADESGFMMCPDDKNVIAERGSASVHQIVGANEKQTITVLFMGNANGDLAPPMVLFDLKTPPKKKLLDNMPKDWGVGISDSGWMTSDSFYDYIVNVFVPWVKSKDISFPILLYVDGHRSHLTLKLCKYCIDNQIELIALYPNATHLIQPLDVSLFRTVKENYKITLREWRIEKYVINFKKHMFPNVLKLSLDKIDIKSALKSGFRKCGLYPFNSEVVSAKIFGQKKAKKSKSVSAIQVEQAEQTDREKSLAFFESFGLSKDLLVEFKSNSPAAVWHGDESKKELYDSWVKMRQACGINIVDKTSLSDGSNSNKEPEAPKTSQYSSDSSQDVEKSDSEYISPNSPITQEEIQNIDDNQNSLGAREIHSQITPIMNCLPDLDGEELYPSPIIITEENGSLQLHLIQGSSPDEYYIENLCRSPTNVLEEIQVIQDQIKSPTNAEIEYQHSSPENSNFSKGISEEASGSNGMDSAIEEMVIEEIQQTDPVENEINSDDKENRQQISHQEPSPQIIQGNLVEKRSQSSSDEVVINQAPNETDKNVEQDQPVQKLSPFKKAFHHPTGLPKKKKRTIKQELQKAALVSDMLNILEESEKEKLANKQKILENKEERERKKKMKEQEKEFLKVEREKTRLIQQEKSEIIDEIKKIKAAIKKGGNGENILTLKNQLQLFEDKLTDVEMKLIDQKAEALRRKKTSNSVRVEIEI